ncbi:histidine kinase [Chryseobacterium sp. Leaf404]|uniref:sensor histidine kinase n=1 Tax=unclassified Chryseobacterium TaxID=2593645 RepID=UPI0006F783C8|nr:MULTISPECIES: HAMP domain-containing sensor histidine kinase [unclassified Chryseobacterium]KQT17471.1 histidine kinase [Chryseobacterium sp. Leaf404]
MKPLLSKTTRPFLIFVLIVLTISIPVYYFVVDIIWQDELDEHNQIVAEKTSYEFNRMSISSQEMHRNIALWNQIQPGTNIQKLSGSKHQQTKIYTTEKYKPFSSDTKIERYRCLEKVIYIKNVPYLFTIETNIEEIEGTVTIIGLITLFFFLLIVSGLFVLNTKLSKSIWQPFRQTLDQLKNFNLNNHSEIEFKPSDTTEFQELNDSLQKLIAQNVSVYKTQKEFTENASHELQTPLAILKNKLDILLQNSDLTEKQYNIAEDMYKALSRSARINQNLLLLAKIENSQFDYSESFYFDELTKNIVENLDEHFHQKDITLQINVIEKTRVKGNKILAEILINNLILNAIRHTEPKGRITVVLENSVFSVMNSGSQKLDENLLFKRFSKISSANSGTGLGLAIIKEIAKSQNWNAEYRFSDQNHCFSVRL